MARDLLPQEVIRILSFHGPVSFWVGDEVALARGEVALAPFEDCLYLFLPLGGRLEEALLETCTAKVTARAPDGSYSLTISGRAHAGLLLSRHPRRPEVQPWAPEGQRTDRLVAASFIPEEVELVRVDGELRQRHAGLTDAGKERKSARNTWIRASFSGLSLALSVLLLVGLWAWLALQGPEYPLRVLALILAALGGLLLLGGVRLHLLAAAFHRWRAGAGPAAEASLLIDALLAPRQAARAGSRALGLGAALLLAVAGLWEAKLAGLALLLSGVWLLAPAGALHLRLADPERKRRSSPDRDRAR